MRRALNDSYAVLEATKYTTTAIAFSFEEAMAQQIERIEGQGSRIRPSELERVDRIEKSLLQAVEEIKQIPPEEFAARIRGRDVNTDEEEEA